MQRVLSFPPSRGFGDPSEFVSKRMCFAFMFALGFLAFLGGFLLGRFVFDKELERSRSKLRAAQTQKEQVFGVYKNYSEFDASSIIEGLSESSIQKYLGVLANQSSHDSSSENLREAEILRNHLTAHGFDLVSPLVQTSIQLSYPSSEHPNEAEIIGGSDELILQVRDIREKYSGLIENKINTTVVESTVIYVNFGRNEDFQYLDSLELDFIGKIFLMRVGKIPTTEMVANAVEHGASGILIYLDPEQTDIKHPLVSPIDLAKLQIRYGNHIDKWSRTIPLLELKSSDVAEIFKKMSVQKDPPDSWKGKLEVPYRISLYFQEKRWKMRMEVTTINVHRTYCNTLGAMRGSQEPDRFVMLGYEKSFTSNEEKSSSVIMEIIRTLGNLKRKGWRPHRSIIVAFWGAEGPNMHLFSHPESVLTQILRKTVAYLKIDPINQKENMIGAKVTPILEKLFYKSAQAISMEDSSVDFMPPSDTDNIFIQWGTPFMMVKYFNANLTLKDVASFWGMTTWQLVESYKLPFGLDGYSRFLSYSSEVIEEKFRTIAKEHSLLLDSLFQSVQELVRVIKSFDDKWSRADKSKSIEMRIMTDQLLDFTRFLFRENYSPILTNNYSSRNLIFSRSAVMNNEKAGFGELQELLHDIAATKNPENLRQQIITHLADVVEKINLARDALSDGLEIFIKGKT